MGHSGIQENRKREWQSGLSFLRYDNARKAKNSKVLAKEDADPRRIIGGINAADRACRCCNEELNAIAVEMQATRKLIDKRLRDERESIN
jgi:hypothetical protein